MPGIRAEEFPVAICRDVVYDLACASAGLGGVEITQMSSSLTAASTPIRFGPSVSLRSFLFAMTHGRAVGVVPADTSRCWRELREMSSRGWTEPEVENRVAAHLSWPLDHHAA